MTRQRVADDPPARGRPWPLPQLELGIVPTPLHPMSGLASAFGGGPELLVKREDLCGVALGGNKLRKLRAILAEAVARRATVVVTTGAPQSNHAAMTAVAAAMHGIRVELHLTGSEPARRTGNLRIAELVGASATFLGECGERERDAQIARRIDELRAAGEMPYLIPLGGSTPLGAAAFATAVSELAGQLAGRPVTHLVVAAGSMGTMAGLVLGVWATGLDCTVHGYTVLWPQAQAARRLDQLIDATRRRYFPAVVPRRNYRIIGSQRGTGYGAPTVEGAEAMRLTARGDGLVLDATYTAKAMAGLIQGIRDGTYRSENRIVFFHTGGAAGTLAG